MNISRKFREYRTRLYVLRLQRCSVKKIYFINALRKSIESGHGYSAGKLGVSQKYWMYYEILLNQSKDKQIIQNFEQKLLFHGFKQVGIFPALPSYYIEFNKFYIEHVRNTDCLGLFHRAPELEILKYYKLKNNMIFYQNQEPDRSHPNNQNNCYLQFFKEKKILIVCPFAHFIKERATKDIFESVWAKTGKKWFYPEHIDSLEFPYGFSPETQRKYSTAIDLFEEIMTKIERKNFDVALIGAAGLAIPIASSIKNMGKIAIDLGGHLQVLFGILGKRWKEFEGWDEMYFNDWWVEMPDKYKPDQKDVCDEGAYW